jgi:hypothetical protein
MHPKHIVEFVIEYYLPITADEWNNLAGPLFRRLSDSDTTNYAFRRHWYRTLKGKTDEWIVTLREIIALKKKGLPYTNPFTNIRYNDNEQGGGDDDNEEDDNVDELWATIKSQQKTIEELQATIQKLRAEGGKQPQDPPAPTNDNDNDDGAGEVKEVDDDDDAANVEDDNNGNNNYNNDNDNYNDNYDNAFSMEESEEEAFDVSIALHLFTLNTTLASSDDDSP